MDFQQIINKHNAGGKPLRELALFAGIGAGLLGSKLLGFVPVCAVEKDPYAISRLVARQNDKSFEPFPIWDDVRTFDGTKWRGIVDIVSGGFPCQDISKNWNGEGIVGERSSLWFEMFRIVEETLPRYVFIENVANIRRRRDERVVIEMLQSIGYQVEDGNFRASDCGAPHKRERTFFLARRNWERVVFASECRECEYCGEAVCRNCGIHFSECNCVGPTQDGYVFEETETYGVIAYTELSRCQKQRWQSAIQKKDVVLKCNRWWSVEPSMGRVDHGSPYRVDKLRALGNAQVPSVVALAWQILLWQLEIKWLIQQTAMEHIEDA